MPDGTNTSLLAAPAVDPLDPKVAARRGLDRRDAGVADAAASAQLSLRPLALQTPPPASTGPQPWTELSELHGLLREACDGLSQGALFATPELRGHLRRLARGRASMADALVAPIRALGGEPEPPGAMLVPVLGWWTGLWRAGAPWPSTPEIIARVATAESILVARYVELLRHSRRPIAALLSRHLLELRTSVAELAVPGWQLSAA